MNKIKYYIFIQILKGSTLIFFIFISIAWLLQITRLISISNLIQVDIFNIVFLSLYLIPNLISIIMPFVIMFGIVLTFIKLNKDRELISIYSLGLNINTIRIPIIVFSIFVTLILVFLNFYISPNVYNNYKIKEFEIRNKINFEKIIVSNFLELNNNTIIDFKRNINDLNDIFIKFDDEKENIIFAKKGSIVNLNNKYSFKLSSGFKLTLNNDSIEKLEFDNYSIDIENNNSAKYNNFDKNTFNIFQDIKNKN